jgi:hypothetical protein
MERHLVFIIEQPLAKRPFVFRRFRRRGLGHWWWWRWRRRFLLDFGRRDGRDRLRPGFLTIAGPRWVQFRGFVVIDIEVFEIRQGLGVGDQLFWNVTIEGCFAFPASASPTSPSARPPLAPIPIAGIAPFAIATRLILFPFLATFGQDIELPAEIFKGGIQELRIGEGAALVLLPTFGWLRRLTPGATPPVPPS